METRYPIRNANGKDFDSQEEILALLRQEKHGRWLSGTNDMWHGGIHISRNTASWSVLTPDTGDDAVPLQCIASGELVAWRVCQDYVMGNLGDKPLQYSPSFLLVRSVHKPTKDSSTWLCFYTLYMHLAPLSCYPKWTVYQVTPRGNGLIMRQYSGSEVSGQKAPPEVSHKARLHSGEQVLIERQETFMLHSGQAEVFGLAQRLKDGAPVGDKFWTSARPAFVEPVGEQYGYLPGWMSVALKAGQFDTVVCPKVMTAIRAGDAIGFLGKEEVPDEFSNVTADWFSHIEVLSNDGRMPLFLNNPAQLHTGRQFLLVPEGKQLYQREEKGSSYSFESVDLTNRGDAADIIPAESATSATDSASVAYLQIRPGTWIRKDDVETVSQNDLTKLKFKAIGQEPSKNQLRSLEQQWVIDAFRWLSSQIWAGRDMESGQLQAYYTRMADELEKVSTPENIQNENRDSVSDMLRHRNLYVDFLLRRLAVKHESEWHGGSATPKWNGVLATMSGDSLAYVKQWLDAHEWMSQVPEFSKDEAVWHFHPVEFLAAFRNTSTGLKGTLTYNAEGNNTPSSQFYSRVIHWPGNAESGVTLGRGYDMGNRSEATIYNDMITSGIDSTTAKKISLARGYKGSAANVFVSDNKVDIGEITEEQQINLFNLIYPGYVTRTIANYNAWTSEVVTAKKWEQLDDVIKEVLVDFVYQGFTKGPNPMLAGANNDKGELIDYIKNTPSISQYEPGRHRAKYLEEN